MKATIFNDLFISKSEIDDSGILPPNDNSLQDIANEQLNHIDITLQDVIDQLATLDINKAYGPDGIGPKVLKNISNSIAPSLLKLFRASLALRTVPNTWKCAKVTPIYKKGDKSNPINNRPISLLCTTGELMERILFNYLFQPF